MGSNAVSMNNQDDVRIIRAAIETEIDSYRYFVEASGKAAHDKVQQIWLSLAGDEIEHMRILQTHLAKISATGEWDASEAEDGGTLPEKAPIFGKSGATAPKEMASDIEALEAGIRVEAATYEFYTDALKKTASEAGRRVYAQLARMEMGHYKLIEETMLMLSDPAGWQFQQVRPILEG